MRRAGLTLWLRAFVSGYFLVVACQGCAAISPPKTLSLAPPEMSRDSVTLEKYSVRFAYGDPALNDQMWSEIDEECLPADLRTRLAANGFRAGVVGAHLPAALDRALREPPPGAPAAAAQPPQLTLPSNALDPKPVELINESKVRRGLWQTRPGHPGILIMAGEQARIERMVVLMHGHDGRVSGRPYEKVMGILALKAFPTSDGRVRLDITPELEHGDPRSRFVAADGMIKPDYRPETVVFDDLHLEAFLAPGQMLVLGSRAEKLGSLGQHFFSEHSSGQPQEQKLLLLRLAQAPADDRFGTGDIPAARR